MIDLFGYVTSPEAADRLARLWSERVDAKGAVGARHHIVPRFLLAKFANASGRISVRDRSTGLHTTRSINDLAVTDFYTAVTDAGLDASLEVLLSQIEGAAAEVLRTHVDASAFARPRPMTSDERNRIDHFVAAQHARGMRVRRGLEMLTDFGVKFANQGQLSAEDIETLEVVSHPNEHLKIFGGLAERTHESLMQRPLTIVTLDQPLLITCDEPVLLDRAGARPILDPNGFANVAGPDIDPRDVIQFQAGRGLGMADAEEVSFAVSPAAALVYGRVGEAWDQPRARLVASDARAAAKEHNRLVLEGSIDWVAAHPSHPTFKTMKMPRPSRILTIADGGSAIARHVNGSTTRRPISRVRAADINDIIRD